MSKSIRLHPEYGLNPAIPVCFFCGKDKNEIILPGASCKEQAKNGMVWDLEPCEECEDSLKIGIMFIEVKDGENRDNNNNPYRTGRLWVIKEAAAAHVLGGQPDFKTSRVYFVEESRARAIGFPHGEG